MLKNGAKCWLESMKGRDHSEDPGKDGKNILKWILGKKRFGSVEWIHLAQYWNLCQTLVNKVMNPSLGSVKGRKFVYLSALFNFSRTLLHGIREKYSFECNGQNNTHILIPVLQI
jgi:hypothetical protein